MHLVQDSALYFTRHWELDIDLHGGRRGNLKIHVATLTLYIDTMGGNPYR